MSKQIPESWETKKLIISDAKESDIETLESIYKNCDYIGEWTGLESKNEHPMRDEFDHKTLPPEGNPSLHRLQSIKTKDSDILFGYIVLYHGFPDEKTFWIAVLALHTDYQGKSFGHEIIKQLINEIKKLQIYNQIGLSVSLKNWPALQFWIKEGFRTIVNFKGDKIFGEKAYADLSLSQGL